MKIQPLKVVYSKMRQKDIQVSRLQGDGFLLLEEDPELWIQDNPADLLSVRFLELHIVKKIGDSIGKLSQLTHLAIYHGHIKCLPNSISSLLNLQSLELINCCALQELPVDLGDLNSLTSLSLEACSTIKSLPKSIQKLDKLISLKLKSCESLKELPANLNIIKLILDDCKSILSLPKGLCKLKLLHLVFYSEQCLPELMYFPSLRHLTFRTCCYCPSHFKELPANLGELSQLLTLNIKDTGIKWLPWSITKLFKLRLLSLPECFRLETLPKHLNDSLVIFVQGTHIRKTWKKLKTELPLFSIPIVGLEATHSPSTPGYLHYRLPGPWIQSNCLYTSVRILDLDLADHELYMYMIISIKMLPELTHLYISNGHLHSLPLTLKKLTHLSLIECHFHFVYASLGELSTLKSLSLLKCINLPVHMSLPVSLTHFALGFCSSCLISDSYMASMTKLSNLKTLNLSGYANLKLSQLHMNLTKLMIRECNFHSLPRSLQHLEIICPRGGWFYSVEGSDELQVCLNQLVDLETLCVRFSKVKVLSNIPRHQTLKELQLIDCFNLENLPPNLDELVELRTLNVSGTRIKTLPDSITKLRNLQHLILPKCFIRKSLPKNFEDKVRVIVDDTYDMFYQHAGYYDVRYGSSEDNKITLGSPEGGDEVDSQELRHDINIEQASSHSLLKTLLDATQVHEGSHLSCRTVPIDNSSSTSQNLEMEILPTVKESCVVPLAPNEADGHHFPSNIWQPHANPLELEGTSLNGRINVVGENNSNALCIINTADDLPATPRLILPESQQGFHSGEINLITSEHKQRNQDQSFDCIDVVHAENDYYASEDGHDKNPQSVDVKHKKTQKIDISKECIQECMSKGMTLECAAKEYKVSRSTMKRRLKELGMTWSKNKKKRHQDAKNKEHNTKLPSEKNFSQPGLVDPITSACHDHRVEHIDGSCSTFDVKATYNGDIMRIYKFSLSSGIEQLKEKVGEMVGLEVDKFKMKFLDEENDWILMRCISDLEHALHLSKSSGSSAVKLSVIPTS